MAKDDEKTGSKGKPIIIDLGKTQADIEQERLVAADWLAQGLGAFLLTEQPDDMHTTLNAQGCLKTLGIAVQPSDDPEKMVYSVPRLTVNYIKPHFWELYGEHRDGLTYEETSLPGEGGEQITQISLWHSPSQEERKQQIGSTIADMKQEAAAQGDELPAIDITRVRRGQLGQRIPMVRFTIVENGDQTIKSAQLTVAMVPPPKPHA